MTKTFKGNEVIKNVSINIKKGEIYGLLGPNGAGKTTLMRMMTGLIKPTAGGVEVFGEYMGYHNKKEIDKVLALVKLPGNNSKKVKEFSLGMKQRLVIGRAILTKPELLILDELINGLDPEGIREIRDLLKLLCKEYGTTILVSSHILSEIEQMEDTIGIMAQGKLIKEVSINNLRETNTEYIEIEVDNYKKAGYILESTLNIKNFKIVDDSKIRVYDCKGSKNELSKALIMNNIEIISIVRKNTSLEDYFLKLTKGEKVNA